jgi:hypothetical protein
MFDSLKAVPKSKDWSKENHALEMQIEKVKSENPHLFLQDHERKYRKFVNEPGTNIPHESFVYPITPLPPLKPAKRGGK